VSALAIAVGRPVVGHAVEAVVSTAGRCSRINANVEMQLQWPVTVISRRYIGYPDGLLGPSSTATTVGASHILTTRRCGYSVGRRGPPWIARYDCCREYLAASGYGLTGTYGRQWVRRLYVMTAFLVCVSASAIEPAGRDLVASDALSRCITTMPQIWRFVSNI